MVLFGNLFKHGEIDKNSLIKNLVRLRLRNDPTVAAMGIREDMTDSLSAFQLAGLPEGTLVTIVETWSILHKQGAEDDEIFSRIEEHRSRMFPRGQMSTPLNLMNYIKYRIELEHSDGVPINEQFIDMAVDLTRKVYGV
jgi:hypothetical protein